MKVSASEKGTNIYNEITVINNKGRLYQEEIDELINKSNKNRKDEKENLEKIECRNDLEEYAYKLLNDLKNKPESNNKTRLINAINNTLQWIKSNPNSSIDEYKNKKAELEVLAITVS